MTQMTVENLLAQMRAMSAAAGGQAPVEQTKSQDFSEMLRQSIDKVNTAQKESGQLADAFVAEDPNVNLTDVMVALQKASVSFQAMTEVRNKLVTAYQEIMNMQV